MLKVVVLQAACKYADLLIDWGPEPKPFPFASLSPCFNAFRLETWYSFG